MDFGVVAWLARTKRCLWAWKKKIGYFVSIIKTMIAKGGSVREGGQAAGGGGERADPKRPPSGVGARDVCSAFRREAPLGGVAIHLLGPHEQHLELFPPQHAPTGRSNQTHPPPPPTPTNPIAWILRRARSRHCPPATSPGYNRT